MKERLSKDRTRGPGMMKKLGCNDCMSPKTELWKLPYAKEQQYDCQIADENYER